MHQITNETLEECRQFLTRPTQIRTHEELLEIVQNLTWAVEELQLRRLAERTPVTPPVENTRPFLLFGNDEAVLKFVDQCHLPDERWKQVTSEEDFRGLHPPEIRARKLDGADEKLWQKWEELEKMYQAKPEGTA